MPCVWSQDVHEDSMQFPSQNSWFLCNCPDGPLKVSERPAVSRSFSVVVVWTTELHRPDSRSSYFEFDKELDFRQHYLGRFCQTSEQRGNTSGCYQCSRTFWVSFMDAGRSDNVECPDVRSSRSDAILFWEEYRYFGNVVAEDHLDAAK